MTTYAPEAQAHRPHRRYWLIAVIAVVALVAAGIVGYAVGGGFTSTATPGQPLSDKVMNVWATGDRAAITETYAPATKVALVYDHTQLLVASSREELFGAVGGAIASGNTYKQVGPVATHQAKNGDLYVASIVEVTGPGHPTGDPLVGFYRVRDGRVIRHIFLDAEHY
jgi:hypothetical protein